MSCKTKTRTYSNIDGKITTIKMRKLELPNLTVFVLSSFSKSLHNLRLDYSNDTTTGYRDV